MIGPLFQFLADSPTAPPDYSLIRVARRAMATQFEIALPVGTPDAVAAAEDALDLIDDLEDQLTIYRPHSEVSRLNTVASTAATAVSANLFEFLTQCSSWSHLTEGTFDIATGALVKTWGFFSRQGRVPTPRERNEALAKSGMRHVILNAESQSVKYRVPGLELNFGAVGKGYALDRAAELLRSRWGIRSALLHAGGSSAFAMGHPPGDERGWGVHLKHPWDATGSLGTVRLRNRGLGTSAATFQHFDYNGRKLGHLLDPRRGWPVECTASASVIAASAAEADAMSTAAFVLGPDAERLTRLRPSLSMVLLLSEPDSASQRHKRCKPHFLNLGPDSYSPPADPD